eukprot:796158-Amphidinium_carterae.1
MHKASDLQHNKKTPRLGSTDTAKTESLAWRFVMETQASPCVNASKLLVDEYLLPLSQTLSFNYSCESCTNPMLFAWCYGM